MRDLAARDSSITVTGTVPDVREHVWQSSLAVAPLHTAQGVQNKVLEAVAAGLPCVVTQEVADGLPGQITPACLLAGTAGEFAATVANLLAQSPAERRAIAERADLAGFDWSSRLAELPDILEAAAAARWRPGYVRETTQRRLVDLVGHAY